MLGPAVIAKAPKAFSWGKRILGKIDEAGMAGLPRMAGGAQRGAIDLGPESGPSVLNFQKAKEKKELGNFAEDLSKKVQERAQKNFAVGKEAHESGVLPFAVGTKFTTAKSRELKTLPWEVAGHGVDKNGPFYYVKRGVGDDVETSTLRANHPDSETWKPFGSLSVVKARGGAVRMGKGGLLKAGAEELAELAQKYLPKTASKEKSIIAYHGSPHDFEKFDISKIGTGEGSQAYGYGLYFAENEKTAKTYRDALTHPNIKYMGHADDAANAIAKIVGDRAAADEMLYHAYEGGYDPVSDDLVKFLKPSAEEIADGVNDFSKYAKNKTVKAIVDAYVTPPGAGRMYQVRINAHPNTFLDWDKQLSEQSDAVKLLAAKNSQIGMYIDPQTWTMRYLKTPATGSDVFKAMTAKRTGVTAQEASDVLRKASIPGIKYLDQGSRLAGKGTRNYVVFDPNIVEFLKKYEIGGIVEKATGGAVRMGKGGLSRVNEAGNYTKPGMRKQLFNSIKARAVQGTKAGQWSARKAQLLAKKYKEQGGGYKD